jgi:hypothetical protein
LVIPAPFEFKLFECMTDGAGQWQGVGAKWQEKQGF